MLFSLFGAASCALAEGLPKPSGAVVLTISGNISEHNGSGKARFDRRMLEALGMRTLHTRTIYSSNESDWCGILMRDLLTRVGAKGEKIEFTAHDDYRAVIPFKEYFEYDVLLAMEKNGKKLSMRTRGPTRIIYPLDGNEELDDKRYAARYVWQIKDIVVK
ncbi:molybdopterin-dependent oxidoreductase [Cohaesibacter celericrescens]|uniref:molybdopterin-dependent oxidoreductase n=1 Tax=Cohaesibacter celericrescens TaxID=2067669 RepID=UPI001FDFC4C1|nr:molybdopterin-dependent oxidoreductase [Cohaesibacter celericrescens]